MLHVSKLSKRYALDSGGVRALENLNIDVTSGEFFTFLGPSGCGKSTALRCIAGLELPDEGKIAINDRAVYDSDSKILVPAHRRDYAMVFQSYAIWPHMSVFENVAFPLRVQRVREQELRSRTRDALELVGLEDAVDRSATLLSGGQQQRVALARAVVRNSKLLLLDEPLSNLDAELRVTMRHELRELQRRIGVTTIYVTHDQDEALSLSDRIALMRDGRLVELGTPRQLYLRPTDTFTARFIGQSDLLPAKVVKRSGEKTQVETALGPLWATGELPSGVNDAVILIRPEHIEIAPLVSGKPGDENNNAAEGQVTEVKFSGKLVEYSVAIRGTSIRVQSLSSQIFSSGDSVAVRIPVERCVLMRAPAEPSLDPPQDSAA